MFRIGINGGGRLQDESIDAAALEKIYVLDASFNIVVAVTDQKAVPACLSRAFKADGQLSIKRIQHVRIDQTNGPSLFGNERNSDLVGNVVETFSGFKNSLTSRTGNATFFAAQNERNRTYGNICGFGNISDCRSQIETLLLRKK